MIRIACERRRSPTGMRIGIVGWDCWDFEVLEGLMGARGCG